MGILYFSTLKKYLLEFQYIEKTFSPSLATALLAIDEKQIESISSGIFNPPLLLIQTYKTLKVNLYCLIKMLGLMKRI